MKGTYGYMGHKGIYGYMVAIRDIKGYMAIWDIKGTRLLTSPSGGGGGNGNHKSIIYLQPLLFTSPPFFACMYVYEMAVGRMQGRVQDYHRQVRVEGGGRKCKEGGARKGVQGRGCKEGGTDGY